MPLTLAHDNFEATESFNIEDVDVHDDFERADVVAVNTTVTDFNIPTFALRGGHAEPQAHIPVRL